MRLPGCSLEGQQHHHGEKIEHVVHCSGTVGQILQILQWCVGAVVKLCSCAAVQWCNHAAVRVCGAAMTHAPY